MSGQAQVTKTKNPAIKPLLISQKEGQKLLLQIFDAWERAEWERDEENIFSKDSSLISQGLDALLSFDI